MPDETTKRFEHAEEAISFIDHKADQLGGEVLRAFAELRQLARQVAVLENRLARLEAPLESPEGDEPADSTENAE